MLSSSTKFNRHISKVANSLIMTEIIIWRCLMICKYFVFIYLSLICNHEKILQNIWYLEINGSLYRQTFYQLAECLDHLTYMDMPAKIPRLRSHCHLVRVHPRLPICNWVPGKIMAVRKTTPLPYGTVLFWWWWFLVV